MPIWDSKYVFELWTFKFLFFFLIFSHENGNLWGGQDHVMTCHSKIYNPPFYYYNLDREFNKSLFISLINVNQIQY
jgi:hypothetical protein